MGVREPVFDGERVSLAAALPTVASGGAEAVWRAGEIAATDLADAFAAHHDLPRFDLGDVADLPDLTAGLSPRFLADAFLYPVVTQDGPLLLTADPGNQEAIAAVALALGGEPRLGVLSFDDIAELLRRDAAKATAPAAIHPARTNLGLSDDVEALQDLARGAPVVRAIDLLLERAVEAGATDIHLESGRDDLRVRFRIDGYLRPQQAFPHEMAAAIISRVKILAGLDIAERRLPQDGRTTVLVRGGEADLRVAVMPTQNGETAVLRILVKDIRLLDFQRVGLSPRDRSALERLLAEPHGLVIVTGPTGSGKTTTLATAISTLNDPARKIVTVEDPIEYQIPGIHQTQIKPSIGLTFASALRSFLRHDPDVIMVGEVRDQETAVIGIQAALTGHLVLTTLHTNSAPDAITRLADMGIEPYLIAAALRGVIGQRLVRRLCERCRAPDPEGMADVDALCQRRSFERPTGKNYHRPVGCPHCGGSGFRGRVGVFEVMRVDDRLTGLIRREPDPLMLLRAAREAGMTTMLEDGLVKVSEGFTSLDEVLRLTG